MESELFLPRLFFFVRQELGHVHFVVETSSAYNYCIAVLAVKGWGIILIQNINFLIGCNSHGVPPVMVSFNGSRLDTGQGFSPRGEAVSQRLFGTAG